MSSNTITKHEPKQILNEIDAITFVGAWTVYQHDTKQEQNQVLNVIETMTEVGGWTVYRYDIKQKPKQPLTWLGPWQKLDFHRLSENVTKTRSRIS